MKQTPNFPLIDRIKQSIDLRGTNLTQVAKSIGTSHSAMSVMLSGSRPISDGTLVKISTALGINYEWLKTGTGEMVQSAGEPVPTELPDNVGTLLPLFNDEFFALGEPKGFALPVEKEKISNFVLFPNLKVREGDFAVIADGHSMECDDNTKNIPDGAVVCLRPWEESFIQFGETYAIATKTGYTIKRVLKGADDNHVICHSNNPDFQDFELDRENDIFGLAKVLGVLTLNKI